MVTESKPSLIVYKASAGSGKTFTLVSEYIKLLVANPQSYRQILAVTFTNKATEEMKMRILSQLYGIWQGLPASRDYTEKIQKELNVSADFVAKQAGIALANLLHNYSYFRVETIDSFFQSVLRNLARELDLTANLRIGLNDTQVEEAAVDKIIDELSTNDVMLQWMLKYIMENIDDDRSWNVINQIKQFGKTIFRDYYKAHSDQLYKIIAQPQFFEKFTAELRTIRKEALDRMKAIGDQFFETLHNEGFDINNLSYGKNGVAGLFIKLQNGQFDDDIAKSKRAMEAHGQPEKWYKKDAPRREALHQLASGPLGRLLDEALEQQPVQWKKYMSADLTLRHLNQLRLLDSIEKKVRQLNEEANNFLLSDTQQLLHDLIEGSDSPFIFEKIGTQLEHIMIDEFQDTSTVQWANFKVLLEEVMSHEQTENLIVGDVKQSIYRWRSGDWRLLSNIQQEFANADQLLKIETLDYNYRSQRNVVTFNNAFFMKAAQEEDIAAYQPVETEVEQKVPEKKGKEGYVRVELLPAEDYQERTLSLLCEQVGELLDKGIAATDMAILVRTNSQIPLIANYFMEHLPQVSIVSDEAFRLDASTAVLVIIQALRLLMHPEDQITEAYLAQFYSQQPLHEGNNEAKLPKEFSEHRHELLSLPLYELTERLFQLFDLQRFDNQTAYLCAFYDQVASYVSEQATDISAFLREWDERICATTIQSSEISGIRLISIHKSKGLEFPHVFIPFCDWRLEHRDILWCQPSEAPFNQLPIVPIDYAMKKMNGTVYEDSYKEEHGQNVVDNMNLLYVAFTRASKSLHVIGKRGTQDIRSYLIEKILPEVAEQLDGSRLEGTEQSNTVISFEYGVPPTPAAATPSPTDKQEEKEKNVFLQKSKTQHIGIETYDLKVEFKQSNKSRDFTTPEEDEETSQQNHYIQMGNVMHHVFSTIRTTADIDTALRQMELDGILYDAEITPERIKKMIDRSLQNPQVADWFSDRWTLYNECTILSMDEQGHVIDRRPDRVMSDGEEMVVVDFKFGRPNSDYHAQVREYMELLKQMGHTRISGYLWYVYQNKIEKVEPEA